MRKVKLIWDFRGPSADKTAQHHELHLKEYLKVEKIVFEQTGQQNINEFHSIAFVVVYENVMQKIRNDLKPHRGQLYEG